MEERQKEVSSKSQQKEEQNRVRQEVVGRCVQAKTSSDSDAETNENGTPSERHWSVITARKEETRTMQNRTYSWHGP
jgi:hypothetical protein